MNRPKTLKEIYARTKDSERRDEDDIKWDIINLCKKVHHQHKLEVLLEELVETCAHDGASNPYC